MTRTMNGTGLFSWNQDNVNKRLLFDVSGLRNSDCYRNDASVFLLLGNAYSETSSLLLKKIDNCFICDEGGRVTIKYVIPFMFNARHSFECKIKALIISITKESAPNNHKIIDLMHCFKEHLLSIDYSSVDTKYVKLDDFNNGIRSISSILSSLEAHISDFLSCEMSDEYYRFLFSKKYEIGQTTLLFDYSKYKNLFEDINVELFEIEKTLHCIGFPMHSV